MSEIISDPHRQQEFYWDQMFQLKVAASYVRLYRDYLGRWVTGLAALRAIASCGSIAAWVIWKQYAFVWAGIIAAALLADALKDVFPFAKKHVAASKHTLEFATLFSDVQLEWENIYSGKYTDDEIMKRLHQLRKLQIDTENRNFPEGLAPAQQSPGPRQARSHRIFLCHIWCKMTRGEVAMSGQNANFGDLQKSLILPRVDNPFPMPAGAAIPARGPLPVVPQQPAQPVQPPVAAQSA